MHRLTIIALLMLGCAPAPAPPPAVAAASDLSAALPEIAALFAQHTGSAVRLTFGSSGALTQQILNGAPFELFMSADEGYVGDVARAGKTEDTGFVYATGRIGIFARHGSRIMADSALSGLTSALAHHALGKFAIANPDHAPYGRAARDVLQHAHLWDSIRTHLVLGENVAQAAQFATAPPADGGLIPSSIALTPAMQTAGTFVLVPSSWHAPLRQRAVLLKNAGATARRFYEFLQSPDAQLIFRRHGFAATD